jgi:hypothetical protein
MEGSNAFVAMKEAKKEELWQWLLIYKNKDKEWN